MNIDYSKVVTAEAKATLAAEATRMAAIDATIKADTVIANLRKMTNAEFDIWWAANVTNLAQAMNVLKRLARITIRRL